jgi:formylglycine-generating enzyme required for sulfatase activity
LLIASIVAMIPAFLAFATTAPAEELPIDDGWRFKFDLENVGIERGWAAADFDDSKWQVVNAGQSWTDFGYFNYSGVAWYRKTVAIPARFRGKFLIFRGIKDRCTLYIEGVQQGKYGPAADPKLRGLFSGTPPFRLRLPDAPTIHLSLRIEGADTHAYDTPGPGLVKSVTLSDSILVFHEGYWLAPDKHVTYKQWLAEMRAERARRRAYFGMNDRVYSGAYAWTSRNFVQAFVYVFDTRFYDVRQGRYLLDEYLADGRRRFGGYDSLLLWHSYTNIGVDSQNQFQMLRSLPGGLPELKKLIDRGHQQGVRTYIAYNPWDRATTQEKTSHIDSLASTVKEIEADGVFLDVTENTPHEQLRAAVDRVRPGVVLEPEGSVPPFDAGNATINASWGQGYPTASTRDHVRGVPIEKWSEPRHMIHFDGDRWRHDRTAMFQHAFLNGTGVVIWDDIFGSWNSYTERDQAMLRRMVPIERHFADLLAGEGWQPFYPTLVKDVDASYWPGSDRALWTIVNWSNEPAAGEILGVEHTPGTRYFDVWNGVEIIPAIRDGQATLKVSEIEGHGLAAIVALKAAPDAAFERLLADCRARAVRKLADYSDQWKPPAPPVLRLPGKTMPARAADPPANMALVPATERFTLSVIHNLGEACCYPDDNRPEWIRRWPYMYEHGAHSRNIMHNIVVPRIPAFFIDKHLVTNAQYRTFLEKSGYRPSDTANFLKHWDWSDPERPRPPRGQENHPVVWVALEDARAYATWAGKRLPTEEEWQYAAGGANHLRYPWGNQWKPGLANDRGEGTTAVDAFPADRSPFGLFDMSGNVWQWNESERNDGNRYAVLRGGSFYQVGGSGWYFDRFVDFGLGQGEWSARPTNYHVKLFLMSPSADRKATIGFRCVKDVAE